MVRYGAWAIPLRRTTNGGFEVLMFQNEVAFNDGQGRLLPFPGEYLFFGSFRREEDNSIVDTACKRLRRLVGGFRLHADITKVVYINDGPPSIRFPDNSGEEVIMHKVVLLLDESHSLAKLDLKTLNGFLALRNRDLHDGSKAFLQDGEQLPHECSSERRYSRAQSVVWWTVEEALKCMSADRPWVNYWQETQCKRHNIERRTVAYGIIKVLEGVLLHSTWDSLLQTPLPSSDVLAEKDVRLLKPQVPSVRVLSYNANQLPMRPFKPARHGQVRRRLRGLLEDLERERFDVICLQEVFSNPMWQDFLRVRPALRMISVCFLACAVGSHWWISTIGAALIFTLLFINLLDAQATVIKHVTHLGYVLVARGEQPTFWGGSMNLRRNRSYILALLSWPCPRRAGSWSDSGLLTFFRSDSGADMSGNVWDTALETRMTFEEGMEEDGAVLKGIIGTCLKAQYSDASGTVLLPALHIFNCHLQSIHTAPKSKGRQEHVRSSQIKLARQAISTQVCSIEKKDIRWIERVPWLLCGDMNVDSIAEREEMAGWGTFRFPTSGLGCPESWEYSNVLLPSLSERERLVDLLKRDMGCHVSTRPKEPIFSLKQKLWYKYPQRLDYIFFRPGSTGTPTVPAGTTKLVLFEKEFGTCSDHYGVETTFEVPPLFMWTHFGSQQSRQCARAASDPKNIDTIWDTFLHCVTRGPSSPCVEWRDQNKNLQSLTYDQVHQRATFFGSGLLIYCETHNVDVLRGRNVALLMENSPDFLIALLACTRYSLVSVPFASCGASTVRFLGQHASIILCHRMFVRELSALGVLLIQVEDLVAGDVASTDIKTLTRLGQRMPLPSTLGRDVATLSACKSRNGVAFVPILQRTILRAVSNIDKVLDLSELLDHRYLCSWSLSFPEERLLAFAMLLRGHCVCFSLLVGRSLMDDIAAFRPTVISTHLGLPDTFLSLGRYSKRDVHSDYFERTVERLLLFCGPTGSVLPEGSATLFAHIFGAPNFQHLKALFCPQTFALLSVYEPDDREDEIAKRDNIDTAVGYPQTDHGAFFLANKGEIVQREGYLHLTIDGPLHTSACEQLIADMVPCTPEYVHTTIFSLEIEQILKYAHPEIRQVAVCLRQPLAVDAAVVVNSHFSGGDRAAARLREMFEQSLHAAGIGLQVHRVSVCEEFSVRNKHTYANGSLRRDNIFSRAAVNDEVELFVAPIPKVINTGFYCRQREDGMLSLVGTSDVAISQAKITCAYELSRHTAADRIKEGVAEPVFSI